MLARRRTIGDFTLAEVRYAPGLRLPRHEHAEAGFCLTFDGTYVESYGRTQLAVAPSVVTFSPAGAPHANDFAASGAHCFTIDVAPSWLAAHGGDLPGLDAPSRMTDPAVVQVARRFFGELSHFDDATAIAVEGLALELLASSVRALPRRGAEPRWLSLVDDAIRAGCRGPIRTSDLASIAGVHPVHLAAVYRARRGASIADTVRALRIEHARELLRRGDEPLASIAIDCGFANQSHFSREFRRATGLTPRQFRNLSC